jgi:antirestriction protein ArdC
MAPSGTRSTAEEREQRRAAERELAERAVEELRTSAGWQRWLGVRRHFHRYSLRNQILISMQNPDATHVAGFRAWLDLGYAVRKGEKAIRIWMPIPPSRKQLEAWRNDNTGTGEKPRILFKLGAVFDRSQVAELPPPAIPAPLDPPIAPLHGDELAHLLMPLTRFAAAIDYTVEVLELDGPDGVCRHATREIAVESSLEPNGQIAALLHELAHALVRVDRADRDPQLNYAGEELVVESVAMSVTGTLGVDTSANSIPYLTAWSQDTPITTIHAHATLIDRLARRLETVVLATTGDSDPDEQNGLGAVVAAGRA